MTAVAPAGPTTRRARARAATIDEMRQVARQLLVSDGPDGLTLRAVAREMGLTAPALYRYVSDHEDLVAGLTADCYAEVVAAMAEARDAAPADDLPGRLLASARAFRGWALSHPREFGLVFTNPVPTSEPECEGELGQAAQGFGQYFADLFRDLLLSGQLRVPDASAVPADFVSALRAQPGDVSQSLPLGVQYLFVRAWARLYGTVCVEVFGHLGWAVDDGEPLFEAALRDVAAEMGLPMPDQRR